LDHACGARWQYLWRRAHDRRARRRSHPWPGPAATSGATMSERAADYLSANIDVKLVHAFDVHMNFHKRVVFGPVSGGARQGYVAFKDGVVKGPRLNGRLMDYSGADFAVVRADGVVESNAHYMIEADDGAPIYIHNRGYIYNTQPDSPGPAYFRCTPYFRAPV